MSYVNAYWNAKESMNTFNSYVVQYIHIDCPLYLKVRLPLLSLLFSVCSDLAVWLAIPTVYSLHMCQITTAAIAWRAWLLGCSIFIKHPRSARCCSVRLLLSSRNFIPRWIVEYIRFLFFLCKLTETVQLENGTLHLMLFISNM